MRGEGSRVRNVYGEGPMVMCLVRVLGLGAYGEGPRVRRVW